MILVDANIPMYLVGADHPNKLAARGALEGAVNRGQRLVTDVEVLQEIMHLAVMRRHEIDTIMSCDCGFDRYPGVARIG